MNYRDILEAAFAAVQNQQKNQGTGGEIADKTEDTAKTDNENISAVNRSASDCEKNYDDGGDDNKDNAKNHDDGGDDNKRNFFEYKQNGSIESALKLIKQLKGAALKSGHDLDVTRATELDEIAEILTGLCQLAAEKL